MAKVKKATNLLKGLAKKHKLGKEELIQDKSDIQSLDCSYLGKVKIVEATQVESEKGTLGIRFIFETLEKDPRRSYNDLWFLKADGDLIAFNYRVISQIAEVLEIDLDDLTITVEGEGDKKKEIIADFEDQEVILHLQHKWEKNTEKGSKTFGKYFCKLEVQSVFDDEKITLAERADDVIKPHRYLKAEENVVKWNSTRLKPEDDATPSGGGRAKVQTDPQEDF